MGKVRFLTRLELSQVADARLGPVSLRFDAGLWVLLGDSPESLGRLFEIAAGQRRARRGRTLLDGEDVFESPSARRKMASLLPVETLLPSARVSESLELAARLRGVSLSGAELLERNGLSRFANLPPETLGPAEQRALALVFSMALDSADALLLFDPFSLHALVQAEVVLARCRALSERACVLVATTRLADAIALGGATCRLERGALLPHVGLQANPWHGSGLVVRTAEAQRLSQLLSSHAAVQSVVFDAQRSTRELLLHGVDLPLLTRSLCEVARAEQIVLEALTPLVPPRAAGSP